MTRKDIERINDYLANLSHYNREVSESWYRVRDIAEKIMNIAESETVQRETKNAKDDMAKAPCIYCGKRPAKICGECHSELISGVS